MDITDKTFLTATIDINLPIEKVWTAWITPEDIINWNSPNADWHTISAENDVRTGGKFLFAMALKDGSLNFDYTGIYEEVIPYQLISLTLNDGRTSTIRFTVGNPVIVTETFEADNSQPLATQQEFCQAVLDKFKNYAEKKAGLITYLR